MATYCINIIYILNFVQAICDETNLVMKNIVDIKKQYIYRFLSKIMYWITDFIKFDKEEILKYCPYQ